MSAVVETFATGFSYTECPRWHDGRLWCSDFYTHEVLSLDATGAAQTVASVPGQPSGLGWLPDGRLLVVSMTDRRVLRQETDGRLVVHADLSGLAPWHLNDMVVAADGSAYVGNFGFDLMGGAEPCPTGLLRIAPDGQASVAADGLWFPNGMVLTDGGRTLVVNETFAQRLTAFDVQPGGGLSGRREWARFGDGPEGRADLSELIGEARCAPDGSCVDAEGAIWVADALFGRVLRVAEGGQVLAEVATDGLGVFACALGGADGRTLFLCAAPSFFEHERRHTRDGVLLATRVDVPAAG